MPATKADLLPSTVESCDRELVSAVETLQLMSSASRRVMFERIDRLLDRRLMLTCDPDCDDLLSGAPL